jgi:hypothetical protein
MCQGSLRIDRSMHGAIVCWFEEADRERETGSGRHGRQSERRGRPGGAEAGAAGNFSAGGIRGMHAQPEPRSDEMLRSCFVLPCPSCHCIAAFFANAAAALFAVVRRSSLLGASDD